MDMMATMNHENVVQYIGYIEPEKSSKYQVKFLIEFITAGSLESLVTKCKFTDRGKTRLLMHVARGMSYLHKLHIIHRDLAASKVVAYVVVIKL